MRESSELERDDQNKLDMNRKNKINKVGNTDTPKEGKMIMGRFSQAQLKDDLSKI